MPKITMVLGAGAAMGALTGLLASHRWRARSVRLTRELRSTETGPEGPVSFASLVSLPDPVQRFFRTVLREGQPQVRSVRVVQMGEFRSKETGDSGAGWQRFEATQHFITSPPGFVWDARVRIHPVGHVRVRDAYVAGSASMRAALLALVPVVDEADGPELRTGALQRYLAESVWFPTALLPSEWVSWTAMDASHARATLKHGAISVSLEFEFGVNGEIVGVYTPGRPRSSGKGRYDAVPWGGRYRRYDERGGMRVPLASEVYWIVRGEEQPYYRGRNIKIEYER